MPHVFWCHLISFSLYSNPKPVLNIQDYEFVRVMNTTIGEPVAHSGRVGEYTGIENLPQINALNMQSPSRKRGIDNANDAATPKKRNNAMPSGGVFDDPIFDIPMVTPYVNR